MLETLAVILIILWLLGLLGGVAVGSGVVHILLVIALVVIVIRLLRGQKV